ncbi:hypothetical protein V1525DRAFT_249727 [Lipomyces kononenkoae]|uniref:Uncharacterized protein n=1 Tax=Lipomyces kononenkoae TaxID=34357 RepID=A0ACC3T9Y3_LIPKO
MRAQSERQGEVGEKIQCCGVAKSTKTRCRRMVDNKYALNDNTAYCFQHRHQSVKFKPKNVSGVNEENHGPVSNGKAHYVGSHNRRKGQDATFTNEVTMTTRVRDPHATRQKNGFSTFWRRLFCMYVDGAPNSRSQRWPTNPGQNHSPSTNTGNKEYVYKVPRVAPATSAKYVSLLAEELKKPISQADEAGYIYVYELAIPRMADAKGQASPDTVLYLKIGRSKNVDRRMHQWTAQCSSAVILTGHFPSPDGTKQCRAAHRAERLIHLELRAMFPCSADQGDMFPRSVTGSVQYGLCATCGKRHTEFFAVRQLDAHIVFRIISKWIEYVGVT